MGAAIWFRGRDQITWVGPEHVTLCRTQQGVFLSDHDEQPYVKPACYVKLIYLRGRKKHTLKTKTDTSQQVAHRSEVRNSV